MSLVQQLLQQNFKKQITHQILSNIQNQAQAVETLIDNLAKLREIDKIQSIKEKIKIVQEFKKLQDQISRFIYTSFNFQNVDEWIIITFCKRPILLKLIEIQKQKFYRKIIQVGKLIFDSDRPQNFVENYVLTLRNTLEKLQKGQQLSHQILIRVDTLNEQFLKYRNVFDNKVDEFNRKILIMIQSMAYFEQNVRQKFNDILQVHQLQTPMKEIDNNYDTIQNQYEQNKIKDKIQMHRQRQNNPGIYERNYHDRQKFWGDSYY